MAVHEIAPGMNAPEPEFRPLTAEQAAMFEFSPNPVLVLDRHFRIRYVNPASAAFGNVDRQALIGGHVWTLYPERRESIFARAYEAVLNEDRATRFEEHDVASGIWKAIHAYPADGGIVAIMEDVSERRRSERALADSEAALARAQTLAAIGSWSLRMPDDIQLSAEAYRVLGLDPIHASVDLDALRARMSSEARAKLQGPLSSAKVNDDIRFTTSFRRFDDDRTVYLDVLLRVMEKRNGLPSHLYGTVQDVSDRVRASEALRRSEETLRLAQEAANIGSFDRDLRTGDTFWSDQLMRIVGVDPATVDQSRIGRDPALDFVHPDDRTNVEGAFRRAAETGEKQVIRSRIIRHDGAERHLLSNAMLVRDEHDAPARIVGTTMDITDQVTADAERAKLESQIQQAQKLESLGILAGGIAHDFNNLLVGILGNASLALLEIDPSHDAHVSIMSIERAAQRAAELTRQLLAYAGKGRFVVEAVDASLAVQEMAALLRTAIGRNATMQMDLATDLPAIDVDATQFRQVVMNLITNATDSIGDAGGLVSVRTTARDVGDEYLQTCVPGTNAQAGRFVQIEVSDTGAGMDAQTMSRIFDPFFTTKFTGRGLGLAATLGIMRSHRGAIRVYSEVGRGTSFCLLFPASAQPAVTTPVAPVADWQLSGEVLVVDDEVSVLAVTSALLTRRGFSVTTVESGTQAIELFRANPSRFVLVLLDLTMPTMDGQATFRTLRELQPDVRVLLMSGYNEQEVTRLFVGRGLAGFLQKPFRADELYDRVVATLRIGRTRE